MKGAGYPGKTVDAGAPRTRSAAPGNGEAAVRSDRIPVLQFLAVFAIGGTERAAVDLARSLDPSRYELSFGCSRRWGELLSEITERGIPVAEYPITNLYNARAWAERLRFARDLKRERIKIVQTYNFPANVFAIPAARLAGIPVVASIQDTGGYLTPLQVRAHRLVCRLAHRTVVNAEAVRQHLITEGHDPRKIVVIRQGINLSRFHGRHGDGRLRREFGLPPGAPLVGVFSRLIPLKGLEHFLEAAALVAPRMPDARFVVVGDHYTTVQGGVLVRDSYRNDLERYAARLGLNGRVVFTGFRVDVPELLREMAVSVLPSVRGEGLSNSILEAMTAGVPIVATTVGGNAEAVEHGVTGLLVPPRDAHALARAICQFLATPEQAARCGAAARDRMTRYFSMERYVRETEALYSELLANAGRRRPPHLPHPPEKHAARRRVNEEEDHGKP